MWSTFSQDFSEFAKAFKSESVDLMDYLGHVASDVVGRGDVYAGDEVLEQAIQDMPLPNELVRRLQEAESTYALPIQPEEKELFAAWMKASPLSSANARRRQQKGAENITACSTSPVSAGSAPPSPLSAMTPNRRSSEWPDEPIDETRQRLLDYSETLLQRYVALVGDAVSPRSSVPATPAASDTRRRLMNPSSAAKFEETTAEPSSEKTAPPKPASPPPAKSPASPASPPASRVSEDDFFDRYFFRLTQLRVSESQHRRTGGGEAKQQAPSAATTPANASTAVDREDVSTPAASAQKTRTPAAATAAAATPAQDNDDDFVAVPLFAKRMMTAASGFVTNIDNVLNNAVARERTRCSGANSEVGDDASNEDSANVDPKDLVKFRGAKQQIADLEALVQELQETLRQERRRVRQLTSVLKVHHIDVPAELPPSASGTPAKEAKAEGKAGAGACVAAPVTQHADAATATVAAPVAAARAPAEASSSPSAAPAVAALTSRQTSPDGSSSTEPGAAGGEKANGVVSVASEEEDDDDAWVSVNPAGEPAAQP